MMLIYIFEHKDIASRLKEEINIHFQTEADFNYENLKKIELIDWIQLETIRMGGPNEALLDRVALTDVMLADIPVYEGTALNYILRPSFFNEKIFEDP